jgi:hypothetical protein
MNPLAIEIWLYVLAAYTLGNINKCSSWTRGRQQYNEKQKTTKEKHKSPWLWKAKVSLKRLLRCLKYEASKEKNIRHDGDCGKGLLMMSREKARDLGQKAHFIRIRTE